MDSAPSDEKLVIPLHAETVEMSRHRVATNDVTVARLTSQHEETIDVLLNDQQVTVEYVDINEFVGEIPQIRDVGNTVIVPIFEEVLVVERRIRLKQEVRIHRQVNVRHHHETVPVRTQQVVVSRTSASDPMPSGKTVVRNITPTQTAKDKSMASETIVAVFESVAVADLVTTELLNAGLRPGAIHQHVASATELDEPGDTQVTGRRGFWGWLLGEENYADHETMYRQGLARGGVVVTAVVDQAQAPRLVAIFEAHGPVDLEERSATLDEANKTAGLPGTAPGATPSSAPIAGSDAAPSAAQLAGMTSTAPISSERPGASASNEEVIPLAEESLVAGKRMVDRGTTRVRRYVVERPVEEQIRLRDERVSVEHRPVTSNATPAADAFSEKTVVVQETGEEAVVGKTARVVEEVVVRKAVDERTETVRDTVRREEVEVDSPSATGSPAPGSPATGTPAKAPGPRNAGPGTR
jgi:uncharacterized protein (TIGR02271 family)